MDRMVGTALNQVALYVGIHCQKCRELNFFGRTRDDPTNMDVISVTGRSMAAIVEQRRPGRWRIAGDP